ncbi:MAG: FecR family protein, partial [Desulfobacterales bacterium]|nr:FecR family protein [Desulfobacterales bacterium]
MKKYFLFSLFFMAFLSLLPDFSAAGLAGLRGNTVNADSLPDDLKSTKIEDYFLDSGSWPVGTVQHLTGHVVVLRKDVNRAYFAAAGDVVYQNDTFFTLKDSRCRIRFSTEDIVTMGENGKIVVEEVNEDHILKKKKSVLNMLRGKAIFYVTRLFKYRNVSATVKTPTAVTGVRGTKFGIEVRKTGEKVADLSDNSFIYLAQNEPGNFETVVYGFEGTVDVTSITDGSTQTVGAGENLVLDNTGAGSVEPTDPNTASQFLGETESGGGGG